MGIICDTSVLIAAEKQRFDLAAFLRAHPDEEFWLAAITASELLHGVERATDRKIRSKRKAFVEGVLQQLAVAPFQLEEARQHARLWAALEVKGQMIRSSRLVDRGDGAPSETPTCYFESGGVPSSSAP